MGFIDLSTVIQVFLSIFYIMVIILEIACTIIAFMNKSRQRVLLFFMSLILISAVQMFMMIEILYEKEWQVPVTDFTMISAKQNVFFTICLLLLMLSVSIFYLIQNYKRYQKEISFNSIKEGFDNLPKAISIINQKGIPVLVNKQMYDFVYNVTGKDFQSLEDIIDILNKKLKAEGILFLDAEEDSIILKLRDNSVWQIEQKSFVFEGESYNEISANEITPIYNLSSQLQEKNRNLTEQKEKQEKLLRAMIQSKKEEEILNLKIDTHAKFGKAILATQLFLENKNETSPIDIWQDVIKINKSMDQENDEINLFSINPLIDASNVFGCQISLDGELPKEEKISFLIVTAMREAITNAVRHAKADEVRISIHSTGSKVKVEIEDNSNLNIKSLKETGGLADLRKKIEKSGGQMQIICQNGVKLIIDLPIDQK